MSGSGLHACAYDGLHAHGALPAQGELTMRKYVCDACGWIYDAAKGDPAHGVPAGTAFENIPDGWVCPECGADKLMFSPLKE